MDGRRLQRDLGETPGLADAVPAFEVVVKIGQQLQRLLHRAGSTGAMEPYFTGTTIKHLPGQALANLQVVQPPLPIQKAIAERNITPVLVEGLKRLEYRGYDSAGVALLTEQGALDRRRRVGKVSELQAARFGFKEAQLTAWGPPHYNGHYTWPRMGFNATFTEQEQGKINAAGFQAKTVRELIASPEGRSWWQKYGWKKSMAFDLRKGSTDLEYLLAYLVEKGVVL